MPTLALIKPNNISFVGLTVGEITSPTFESILAQYVEIVSVNTNDMQLVMQHIVNHIKLTSDEVGDSYKCYETYNAEYHLIYRLDSKNVLLPENTFGRFLSRDHCDVRGFCILIKSKINDDGSLLPDNIDLHDVRIIMTAKLVHKSMLIRENEITEFNFIKSPVEQIEKLNSENCKYVTIEYLGKTILMFMEHEPTDKYINRMATIMYKKYKIIGDVVIALLSTDPTEFQDIDIHMFTRLMAVMSDSTFGRDISDTEIITAPQHTTNFYKILNDRYAKYRKSHSDNFVDIIPDDIINGPTMNSTLVV